MSACSRNTAPFSDPRARYPPLEAGGYHRKRHTFIKHPDIGGGCPRQSCGTHLLPLPNACASISLKDTSQVQHLGPVGSLREVEGGSPAVLLLWEK